MSRSILLFLSLLTCPAWLSAQDAFKDIWKSFQRSELPQADSLLNLNQSKLSKDQFNFLKASLQNKYGKANSSDSFINLIKAGNSEMLKNDSIRISYHRIRYENAVNLFDYARAAKEGAFYLDQSSSLINPAQLEDELEAWKIWQQLNKAKPQTIILGERHQLPFTKDFAGLWNIGVSSRDTGIHQFVFDSGAGLSVITDNYAAKLGMRILPGERIAIKSGITGIPTKIRLAVADSLRMGSILIKDAVFLVFPDSSLSFGGGAYRINGIIGFPIIKELGELIIEKDRLTINNLPVHRPNFVNLSMDNLKPIIYLKFQGTLLPFTFDTGAGNSVLSDVFYKRYAPFLDTLGKPITASLGGTSGTRKFKGLIVPELIFQNGVQPLKIKDLFISKEVISTNRDIYYGNLGQDLIKQFTKLILNFKDGYIVFEN